MARLSWKFVLFLMAASCVFLLLAAPALHAQTPNNCLICHSQLDPPLGVTVHEFTGSIHAQKGLTCTSCHGGDASTDDIDKAKVKSTGFKGHIERAQIPALCGKCHSDAAYMRSYNPKVRTDQFSQYQTSVHGKLLAKGDTRVAVCTDCHTAHNIHPPSDPQSTVYPRNVATTCSKCHADAALMKDFKIPTDQFSLYSTSVHNDALMNQGDLSAPTCSTCHGSHGAAPPGVASVERVCSTCHVFQQQLYDAGAHKDAFESMGLPGCIVCHTNHAILHPSDATISTDKDAVCMKCHSSGEDGYTAAAAMHDELRKLDGEITRSEEILTRAATSGVEVGDARLALSDARDDLTKARVSIHSVQTATVDQNVQAGLKVTQKTWQAGLDALAELKYRREGLAVSIIAIVLVLFGIALLIRKLESQKQE